MDGNGRWARARGLPRAAGHRKGVMVVREIVTACAELGVKALTLYAFSADNYWKRPRTEVMVLMGLPAAARVWLKRTARATSRNSGLVLTLALNYSSRQEILDAARKLAVRNGTARKPLERDDFRGFLSTAGLPDPDLVIRTSGEMRLSDFLLWQAAYAELWFTSVLWPDFRRSHLIKAIRDFQRRQRRFGAVTALAPARPALGQLRWPRTPA